jgi:nucleoside-diphosphate-sugar epimerase
LSIHLGAIISIPYSYQHPLETAETNFMGTLAMCCWPAAPRASSRLVHTSTSEVYGTAQFTPMDESHPLQGTVALLGQQDRRRQTGGKLLPFV